MKNLAFIILSSIILLSACKTGDEFKKDQVESFHLSSVRLLESPFKNAEQVNIDYLVALDPDKLLAPFLREAGLEPKAESYGNWESSGLDGHIGGHYLTALSLKYASTGNEEIFERLDYMLTELKRCQDQSESGYMGGIPNGKEMWKDISEGNINAASFSLNDRWVPWYNIHKLYAGLYDAFHYTGNQKAKEMLIKLTDWCVDLVSDLSDEQIQDMLRSEHGGINEVFANVAEITGEDKYMELAKQFSHREILLPLLDKEDQLTGMHANTQIPKIIGVKRIADLTGNEEWDEASKFFWQTIVNNRTVSIGGNSVREHFHPTDDFSPMINDREGPETCNTYNMLRLSKLLYHSSSSIEYIDFYERALYNHILSTQHPEHGGLVYFTSMRPRHYRVYSQPEKAFWCCVGSGIENHGKYGKLIYAHADDELFVNLFIPSVLTWEEKDITLKQTTDFPDEGSTTLTVNLESPRSFTLSVRYPSWIKEGELQIKVNNEIEKISAHPGSYASITRTWNDGDEVQVLLPMHTWLKQLQDGSDFYTIMHGPIALAAQTGQTDLDGLIADDSRWAHIASGDLYPLDEAPGLIGTPSEIIEGIKPVQGKNLTFKASEVIYPSKYDDLELIPFYRVHDSRYMIYWQQAEDEDFIKTGHQREEDLALDRSTIDHVETGQQQPEADHSFRGENTETGIQNNRHWRHAEGWFSYELRDENKEAKTLQITYYGLDSNRNFDILINDTKIATVNLDGSEGDTFFTVDYPIPAEVLEEADDNILVTKFEAHEGSIAGGVYHVRLLK